MRERCCTERADDMHMDPKQPLRMWIALSITYGRDGLEHEEAPNRWQSGLNVWSPVRRSCS